MAINAPNWPYSGRLSLAAHRVAVALVAAARETLELNGQPWEQVDPQMRMTILRIAESAVTRAVWVTEDRERRQQRSTP